jgi:hypothetical protein
MAEDASSIPNTTSAGESDPGGPDETYPGQEPGTSIPNTSSVGATDDAESDPGS